MIPPAFGKILRWLVGPGRTMTLLVLVALAFGFGAYVVWRAVRGRVVSSEGYWVTVDAVEITPLPSWIHKKDREKDLCREVFLDASLAPPLWLLDEKLCEQLRVAFSANPWVAKVNDVRKYYPARVQVELVYRRPVCVVEIGSERLPVDVDGVLLPSEDLPTTEAARYPRLVGIEKAIGTLVGRRWNDPRVAGAAQIADAFGPAWEKLGLEVIVPLEKGVRTVFQGVPSDDGRRTGRENGSDPFSYELVTRGGTRILWGRAPHSAFPGESTPAEKVGRLEEYYKEHGTLEGTSGPQQLDLTRVGSIERR
jgi:hypothetical protein